jgi:hypothetical protein
MIYDTAKELRKLKIDWTAGAQGLQMICKHFPGKCPFYAGTHREGELAEWPPLEEMIAECQRRNAAYALSFMLNMNGKRWRARMDSVFTKSDYLEGVSGEGDDAREAVAKLLISLKNG